MEKVAILIICMSKMIRSVPSLPGGGRSSVVRASEFKSEDPGFDPMVGQGGGQDFFCIPARQLLCRLVCA